MCTFIDLFIWNFLKLNEIYILVFSLNNSKHYINNKHIQWKSYLYDSFRISTRTESIKTPLLDVNNTVVKETLPQKSWNLPGHYTVRLDILPIKRKSFLFGCVNCYCISNCQNNFCQGEVTFLKKIGRSPWKCTEINNTVPALKSIK